MAIFKLGLWSSAAIHRAATAIPGAGTFERLIPRMQFVMALHMLMGMLLCLGTGHHDEHGEKDEENKSQKRDDAFHGISHDVPLFLDVSKVVFGNHSIGNITRAEYKRLAAEFAKLFFFCFFCCSHIIPLVC